MCDELGGLICRAIWFILPAYVANASPVILGGGRAVDGGKKMRDGRPIFGPGKTIRGIVGGMAAGTVTGIIQALLTSSSQYILVAILLSAGALIGDLLGSFIKRRLNIPRGGAAPLLDQLGFVIFAILIASPFMFPGWEAVVIIMLITPPLHLATNFIGYKMGVKSRPY
ncbi:MAG: CDP-2,3-bis-(O-geranylgeranyl)-sn-glycerol synthase [Candidatus Hadarchaeales archaeon]